MRNKYIRDILNSKLFVSLIFAVAVIAVGFGYYSLNKFGPLEWIGIALVNGYLIFVGINIIVNGDKFKDIEK